MKLTESTARPTRRPRRAAGLSGHQKVDKGGIEKQMGKTEESLNDENAQGRPRFQTGSPCLNSGMRGVPAPAAGAVEDT